MKVLSLDGGGARGLIQARTLVNLESFLNERAKSNVPLGHHFDLVVGTSVGGIIAMAIASGASAANIEKFIMKCAGVVFQKQFLGDLASLFQPKFRQAPLRNAATDFFGNNTLSDLGRNGCEGPAHACVVSQSAAFRRARLFKSAYSTHLKEIASQVKLSDVVLATSAAPTFFPAARVQVGKDKNVLLDGGLVANNPALIGLLEAAKILTKAHGDGFPNGVAAKISEVKLISVGTGKNDSRKMNQLKHIGRMESRGLLWWAQNIYEQMSEAQTAHAEYTVSRLLPMSNYVRLDLKDGIPTRLDEVEEAELGMVDAILNREDIAKLDAWLQCGTSLHDFSTAH